MAKQLWYRTMALLSIAVLSWNDPFAHLQWQPKWQDEHIQIFKIDERRFGDGIQIHRQP